MLTYRLYYMNPRSGHIDRRVDIEAPSDRVAIRLAEEHVRLSPLELWRDSKKVHRFEALQNIRPFPIAHVSGSQIAAG